MRTDTPPHEGGPEPEKPDRSDVRLTLPARAENVAVVRHVLGALADTFGMPDGVREDLRLAVTEACTNVVRHAYVGDEGGSMVVDVRPHEGSVEVVVADRGRGIAPNPRGGGAGLGLPLIAALTDSMEIQHAPDHGSRLAMCFRYDRPGAPIMEVA